MVERERDIADTERALERLLRRSMSRKEHERQTAAVGASVSRAGYAILRSLEEGGPRTLRHLARDCAMDPAAAVRQLHVLEADGLVERSGSATDGRLSVLRLTRRGRSVQRRLVAARTAYLGEVLQDWSAADCATLARLVDRLVDDLRDKPFGAGVA